MTRMRHLRQHDSDGAPARWVLALLLDCQTMLRQWKPPAGNEGAQSRKLQICYLIQIFYLIQIKKLRKRARRII